MTPEPTATTLTAHLRAATSATHARIEALPLSVAMAEGTIGREEYCHLLRLLLTAHEGWEREVARTPACAWAWAPDLARADVIRRDLLALGAEPTPVSHPAINVWLAAVRERAEVRPEVWLGAVYLFEGSRMGSLALARPLARALGVSPAPGCGLDYHLDGAAGRVPRWTRFKAALDAFPLAPEQQRAAAWGAAAMFQMLYALYAAPAPAGRPS